MEIVTRILFFLIVLVLISPWLNPEIEEEKNNRVSSRSHAKKQRNHRDTEKKGKAESNRYKSDVIQESNRAKTEQEPEKRCPNCDYIDLISCPKCFISD